MLHGFLHILFRRKDTTFHEERRSEFKHYFSHTETQTFQGTSHMGYAHSLKGDTSHQGLWEVLYPAMRGYERDAYVYNDNNN